jgi:hypothetical protein
MLSEIVTDALEAEPDFEVLGEVDGADVHDVVEREPVDFVVVGRDDDELAVGLLGVRPRMKVLGVIDDGRDAALYELRPRRALVGELSPERLVRVIREAGPSAPAR